MAPSHSRALACVASAGWTGGNEICHLVAVTSDCRLDATRVMSLTHAPDAPAAVDRPAAPSVAAQPGKASLVESEVAQGESSADGWMPGPSVKQMDAPAERETGITTTASGASREGTPGRRVVGVGEHVTLTSADAARWTATDVGKGAAKGGQGGTYHWVAPARAGAVTIQAAGKQPNSKPESVTFEVVEPYDVEFQYVDDAAPKDGAPYGAGVYMKVNFLPHTVSWEAVEWLEISGGPSNKQGVFSRIDDKLMMHNAKAQSFPEPIAHDTAAFGLQRLPDDIAQGGSYQWVIPNHFRVGKTGETKHFVDTVQTMTLLSTPLEGYAVVSKKGQSTTQINSKTMGPNGKELPRKIEQAVEEQPAKGEASGLVAGGEAAIAIGEGGAKAAPAQLVRPTLEIPAEIKVKLFEREVPNTPFKFEGELSTEVKAKVETTGTAAADKQQGAGVKGGPGLEVDLNERKVKVITKTRVEKEMNLLNLKFLGLAEQKRSKDGVEILVGFEKNGTVLGAPFTVKITTGGAVGKKNEIELFGVEGGIDLPAELNVLQLPKNPYCTGVVDWTMIKVKAALKADMKSVVRWLIEKGAMGAEAALPAMLTAAGAIGGPLVFSWLAVSAFADMENLDNPVSDLATQGAVACKRLPEFLQMAKSTNRVETTFVGELQKIVQQGADAIGMDPHWVLEGLRHNRDSQAQLRAAMLASTKASCIAQGLKMADEYYESKWISILSKQHYRERAQKIVETRFGLVEGAGWS